MTTVPYDLIAEEQLAEFNLEWEEKYERLTKRLRSETVARNKLRLMYDGKVPGVPGTNWTTKRGEVILVEDMTPNHAANTVAMLERRALRDAYKLHIYDRIDAWFEGTPLVTALRDRARDKATLGDRLRDRRALRAWEKTQR